MKCLLLSKFSNDSVTHQLSQSKTQSYKKEFVDFIYCTFTQLVPKNKEIFSRTNKCTQEQGNIILLILLKNVEFSEYQSCLQFVKRAKLMIHVREISNIDAPSDIVVESNY